MWKCNPIVSKWPHTLSLWIVFVSVVVLEFRIYDLKNSMLLANGRVKESYQR
jgi:hypothetical protein